MATELQLEEGCTVSSYNIHNNSQLEILGRILEGSAPFQKKELLRSNGVVQQLGKQLVLQLQSREVEGRKLHFDPKDDGRY